MLSVVIVMVSVVEPSTSKLAILAFTILMLIGAPNLGPSASSG